MFKYYLGDKNMNKDIKLVVADIDMTLKVGHDPMPELNLQAIKDLHKNGYLFGMASGRSVSQIKKVFDDFHVDFNLDLAVAVNGSAMYDGLIDQEDDYLLLQPEWVKDIVEVLRANNVDFYMYINDETIFSNANDEYYREVYVAAGRPAKVAVNDVDFLNGKIYKGLVQINSQEEKEKIYKMFEPLVKKRKGQFKLLMTTKECIEFVHYDTSKAFALKKFCDRHNIDYKNVAAFGDADNDNEMIQMSGMGVCLKNGVEETMKLADYITDLDCGEGGFGDFVYKHILNK